MEKQSATPLAKRESTARPTAGGEELLCSSMKVQDVTVEHCQHGLKVRVVFECLVQPIKAWQSFYNITISLDEFIKGTNVVARNLSVISVTRLCSPASFTNVQKKLDWCLHLDCQSISLLLGCDHIQIHPNPWHIGSAIAKHLYRSRIGSQSSKQRLEAA